MLIVGSFAACKQSCYHPIFVKSSNHQHPQNHLQNKHSEILKPQFSKDKYLIRILLAWLSLSPDMSSLTGLIDSSARLVSSCESFQYSANLSQCNATYTKLTNMFKLARIYHAGKQQFLKSRKRDLNEKTKRDDLLWMLANWRNRSSFLAFGEFQVCERWIIRQSRPFGPNTHQESTPPNKRCKKYAT